MTVTHARAARRTRAIVLGIGVLYLLLAIGGFIRAGFSSFGWEEPVRLLGFLGVSTLLSIAHTFAGALALVAALRGAPTAFAAPATVAFTAMAVFGAVSRIFADTGDPLNMTWWNVGLYVLTAATCAYVYSLRLRAR